MKTCNKCLEEKSADNFYKQKKHKDGLSYTCKECRRKIDKSSKFSGEKVCEICRVVVDKRAKHPRCKKHYTQDEKDSENYYNWKGDGVGLTALHRWVQRRWAEPPACQDCGKITKLDLANISQNYLREITDWEWLCRKCHMIKDGRMETLQKTQFQAR